MIRLYTFTVEPPEGVDPMVAGPLMVTQLDRMAAQSKDLLEAEVEATGDGQLLVRILYQARDAWYIHKRIKFPLVAALRRGGMKIEHVKATQVSVPATGRDRPAPRVPPQPRGIAIDRAWIDETVPVPPD